MTNKKMNITDCITKVWKAYSKGTYEPGVDYNGYCAYRSNGEALAKKRCSFGILIPDKLYKSEMEGQNIDSIIHYNPGVAKLFYVSRALIQKLYVLQGCHDDSAIDHYNTRPTHTPKDAQRIFTTEFSQHLFASCSKLGLSREELTKIVGEELK